MNAVLQSASSAKRDSQKMYSAAKQLELEHSGRLAKIQSDLQALHNKQKQLAEVFHVSVVPASLELKPFDTHCCHYGYSYKVSCARPG